MNEKSWSGPVCRVCVLGATVLLASSSARADGPTRCPVPEGADKSLAGVDAEARLDFLRGTIDEQGHYAHLWKWWWFGIGDATFAGSVAFMIAGAASDPQPKLFDRPNFVDGLVVSGFSIVTPITALLFSPRAEGDAQDVDTLFAATGNGRAGECEVLARTEEIFAKTVDDEAFNTSWLLHAAAILGNAAMFTIMAALAATASDPNVRDTHWLNAALNTGAGLILTEAQILTAPRGAVTGWRRYLKGDVKRKAAAASFSVAPLGLGPGVALSVRF